MIQLQFIVVVMLSICRFSSQLQVSHKAFRSNRHPKTAFFRSLVLPSSSSHPYSSSTTSLHLNYNAVPKQPSMSGINLDGTLKKYATPVPTSPAAIAASTGDISTLASSEVKPFLWTKDEHGNFPLIWAADKGHADALQLILSSDKVGNDDDVVGINTRGYLGNTAIGRAARGGHLSCVKLLIEQTDGKHGIINPNIRNEKDQYPLHFAAFKKHPEVVRVLLDSGLCDTMVKDRKGRTPAEDTSVDMIRDMILEYRSKAN
mmetsp:Transcript_20032/g.43426  ORF Transcript_20032/g.43426 Transcript_20032/m.43426 type:complete len:260 (-) Transcript_20032:24-803(-)